MNFFHHIASNLLRGAEVGRSSAGGDTTKQPDSVTDDATLVHRAQAGDFTAFDELVTRHRGKVYAMIVNMVHNNADAWDLAQDSFIKAWKALPKFENRSKFSTWLFRISHNVVYDWARKKKINSEGELDDQLLDSERIDMGASTAPKVPSRPDDAMSQHERRAEIEAALAQLSDGHREVILLREVQGMDYKEIATVVDCTVGTVMSRLFYARKKLQTLLKP